MTHAISAAYSAGEHPHQPAGSPTGGQFAPSGGNGKKSPAKTAPKGHATPRRSVSHPARHDDGTLAYDSKANRGTGYGSRDGDPRVHKLQEALNRLGLKDSAGKPLKLDGKLGPKTTAAIRKAQHRLGLTVDGKVTPALLAKITGSKTLTHAAAEYAHTEAKNYADPGYQKDGKKRYALDSEAECRAAWSYIHQAKNREFYTADQLKAIEGRIKAAGRKYGIDFADKVNAAAADLHGVELARPGPWKVASGDGTFTAEMLRDAADFFTASGGQSVPVKLGHRDSRFDDDGEPAFGSVTNVRYAEDDRGPVLLGDIVNMPGWLSASAPRSWPNRSIEGWQNFTYADREYSLVLTGLAFLGVTPPAVRNIRSLADLQTALAASSALRIVASAPSDDPAQPPEAPEYAELFPPQTAAPPAEIPHTEGAGMTLANYREALAGLPDDASEDDVKAALEAAGFTVESSPPPEPVQASLFEPAGEKAEPAKKEPINAAGSWMRVEASAWEAAQDRIKALEAQEQKRRVAERDQVIAKAVQDGKFAPARREHWVRLWNADPDGTRDVIGGLARNVIPVMASGYAGGDSTNDEIEEYAALWGRADARKAG